MREARGRKPKRRTSHRPISTKDRANDSGQAGASLAGWRAASRMPALRALVRQTSGLKWTRALFLLLLDELYIGDEFEEIVGKPEKIPSARYPQAIAVAIAMRHSWRADDLGSVVQRLDGTTASHPRYTR